MGAKLPPRWRYVGQPGAQDGQLGSILGAILAPLSHLGTNSNQNGEKAKNSEKLIVLKSFWVVWVSIWSDLEAMLHDFGGPGGILGILGGLWRKVVPKRRPKRSQDGPRCAQRGQLERTWKPSCLQDSLDEPRWFPKWSQVGHLGRQVGHHSAILAPTWPPCSLKLASLSASWAVLVAF